MCVSSRKKRNYRPVRVVAFWWFHHKSKNRMIIKWARRWIERFCLHIYSLQSRSTKEKAWWLIVDTDDRSQMLIIEINLWLLLFDYAHISFSHVTHQSRKKSGPLNWLCIKQKRKRKVFLIFEMKMHLTGEFDYKHKQLFTRLLSSRDAYVSAFVYVRVSWRQKRCWSILRVRLGWTLSFSFSCLYLTICLSFR